MQIAMTNFDVMTDDKAKFVEEQANRLFGFVMESRAILVREAHTTINWLFGLIVASSGYIVTLLNTSEAVKWWLVIPLFALAACASWRAVLLFHYALRSVSVFPAGNEPKNLLTDEFMGYEIAWMRAAEAAQLQERIEKAREHNYGVGEAINRARWCIAMAPAAAFLLALFIRFNCVA